jgi:hypothetical protein
MLHSTLRRGALALGAALAVVAGSSAFAQPTQASAGWPDLVVRAAQLALETAGTD